MKLSDLSVRRPVLAGVMNVLLLVFGIVAYGRIGVDLFPEVDFPVVTVTAVYPGADPGAVESKVVEKLEERINTISGIKTMRSVSLENAGQVIVEFDLDTDVNQAAQDVRDQVSAALADLPPDIDPPTVE